MELQIRLRRPRVLYRQCKLMRSKRMSAFVLDRRIQELLRRINGSSMPATYSNFRKSIFV
jgi:hypothetical protein